MRKSNAYPGSLPEFDIYNRPQYRPHMRERMEVNPTLPKMRVEDALGYYFEYIDLCPTQQTTKERIRAAMRSFKKFAAKYLPEDVPTDEILEGLLRYNGETPRRMWKYWNQFYGWVYRNIGLERNPLLDVDPGHYVPPIKRNFRFLLPEDMDMLRCCADLTTMERLCINFMHDCGARPVDMVPVKTGDIDWARKRVRLYRGKTGDTTWGYLSHDTLQAINIHLRFRRAQSDWLFDWRTASKDEMPQRHKIKRAIRNAAEKAFTGNPDIIEICTPLAIRHTACSDMARSGLSAHEIAKIMGHSSTKMIERYIALIDTDTQGAAEHFLEYLSARRGALREIKREAEEQHERGLNFAGATKRVRRRRDLKKQRTPNTRHGRSKTA